MLKKALVFVAFATIISTPVTARSERSGRGDDASVLLDGVGVADPEEIGGLITDPETRVVSF